MARLVSADGTEQLPEPVLSVGDPSDQPGRSAASILVTVILTVTPLVVLLAAWDLAVRFELVDSVLLPPPLDVWHALVDLFTGGLLGGHVKATVTETLIGFVLAVIGGFVVGSLLAFFPGLRRCFYPYIVVFQALPKVALAPLFVAWLGFGMSSKIGLAAAIAFFPVLINTMVGLQSVPADSMMLMRSLVASRSRTFFSLALPSALPAIFAGIKTSMTLALIGAIVAEFVGARKGLAVLIDTYSFQFRMDSVYAVLVVLSLIGLVLYGLVEYVDRRVVFWREDGE